MLSLLDDPSIFDHDNKISVHNGGQTMGDDECRSTLQEVCQCLLDHKLCLGIYTGSGLIQDQDPWIGQERPGKRDELALSHGQPPPALFNLSRITGWQLVDKRMCTYGLGRADNLLLRCVQPAKPDVVCDTGGEEKRVLQHYAHLPPQALLGYLTQIVSINGDPAFGGIMKAAEQFNQGRFPSPGFPDQGDGLAGGHIEIDICQDPLRIIGVVKGDFFKGHPAVDHGQIECNRAGP